MSIMVTLTRERVLAAAPIDRWQREQLQGLLVTYPSSSDNVYWHAWEQLIKWYGCESREIGERRAFWGLVYRLLDEPTADDIECIKGWVNLKWRLAEGFYTNPTKQPCMKQGYYTLMDGGDECTTRIQTQQSTTVNSAHCS